MKKILLISAFASVAISNVALADTCPSQAVFNVQVAGSSAGTAAIAPTTLDVTSVAGIFAGQSTCAFGVTWNNPIVGADVKSVNCNLAQFSTFGQPACGGSSVSLTDAFGVPLLSTTGCQGFDTKGVPQSLSVVLSPVSADCALNGLVTFTATPFMIESIAFKA